MHYLLSLHALTQSAFQEITLCSEIQNLLNRILEQIKLQIIELKTIKAQLENDWSDKIHTYNIESVSVNLSNDSSQIMWRAGSTRFPTVWVIWLDVICMRLMEECYKKKYSWDIEWKLIIKIVSSV